MSSGLPDRRRRLEVGTITVLSRASRLRERDDFLGEVQAILDGTWAYPTGAIVIEGVPGSGKTAMVNAGCHVAGDLALRVLKARGEEGDVHEPLGVVRQLLGPLASGYGQDDAASPEVQAALEALATGQGARPDRPELMAGLTALLLEGADAPTVIAVDDVHCADVVSAAWLHHLARRVRGDRVRVLVSTRPRRAGVPLSAADRLVSDPSTRVFTAKPLTVDAESELISEHLGQFPDATFAAACHGLTGGNPALVIELLRALAPSGMRPVAPAVPRLQHLSSPSVARAALTRLAALTPGAFALVEAVAVLAPRADLRVAAALAGIEGDEAGTIADALADAFVFRSGRPLDFVHPFVRSSLYAEISPTRRSKLHAEAAQLLAARGVAAEELAAHLLETEPRGNGWVVSVLIELARGSLVEHDAALASRYYDRAEAEPPQAQQRGALALVGAEIDGLLQRDGALARFEEARRLGCDVSEWAATGLRLVERFWDTPLMPAFAALLAGAGDGDEAALLDPERHRYPALPASIVGSREGAPRTIADRVAPLANWPAATNTPAGRLIVARLASLRAAGPSSSKLPEVAETVASVLTPDFLGAASGALTITVIAEALSVLVRAGATDVAAPLLRRAKHAADADGRTRDSALLTTVLAEALSGQGRLREAEELIAGVLALSRDTMPAVYARAQLCWSTILALRGSLDRALEALNTSPVTSSSARGLFDAAGVLEVRGRLHLLGGSYALALRDFDDLHTLAAEAGITNPAMTSWRAGRCEALVGLAEHDEAAVLARENLELARQFGAPVVTAEGLRLAAVHAPVNDRLEMLLTAVDLLDGTAAEIERCKALLALGEAWRATGDQASARRALRRGADVAVRVGAAYLVQLASNELRATGARPRRLHLSGADALTPSEHRAAMLAAQGCTNAEIASSLYVSLKTVESHLSRAYRKLGVTSRRELRSILGVGSTAD